MSMLQACRTNAEIRPSYRLLRSSSGDCLAQSQNFLPEHGAGAMNYRRFTDTRGELWEAWEVHPTAVERRVNADRRAKARLETDRRKHQEYRLEVPRELSSGWLAFQKGATKLRVTPIPEGWQSLTDHELTVLMAQSAESAQVLSFPTNGIAFGGPSEMAE